MTDELRYLEAGDLSIEEYGIYLEEIARANFRDRINIFNHIPRENTVLVPYDLSGLCRFYFPIDVNEVNSRSFEERLSELGSEGIFNPYLRSVGIELLKKQLNRLIRNSGSFEKTELFNEYINNHRKLFSIVILESI